MITNRTQNDVDTAMLLRLKLESGQTLTEDETAVFLRGTCTNDMLNRLENKINELSLLLNKMGYPNTCVSYSDKHWANGMIFKHDDYQRLFDNLKKLKSSFYVFDSTPKTPTYLYGWKEANDIEQILVDIDKIITLMKGSFRKCGTFKSDQGGDL